MKKTKLVAIVLAVISILSPLCMADGAYTTPEQMKAAEANAAFPEMSAESYVVMDSKTGEVLFSKDSDKMLPIASTTKMMTALVVVEKIKDLDSRVTVDPESCGIEGSSVNLYRGEEISVKDLLYALMLESANDAAVCLAKYTAGSVEAFADLMNERASKIGMTNSHFANPHGLEDEEHYSTAYDMAKLYQEAMKYDVIRKIVSTKTYKMELDEKDSYRFLSNHNKLLKTYEPCVGGKTGFTKAAGRCLVTVCEKNGVELITVTLNDPNDWQDHESIVEYSFSLYSQVRLAEEGEIKVSIPVVGGVENSVTLSNKESLELSVKDVSKITSRVEAPHFLYAPVEASGKAGGKVTFYYDGKEIARLDLYSDNSVQIKSEKKGFFKRLWQWIFG